MWGDTTGSARSKRLGILALGLFGVMQFFLPERTNPPVLKDLAGPDNVRPILERACYDCHSNQTDWPWYAYVAPVSWLVADHVNEARRHLNFSSWRTLNAAERKTMREAIYEMTSESHMPPGDYALLHSEAALSAADLDVLRDWSLSSISDKPKIKTAPQLRQADPKTPGSQE